MSMGIWYEALLRWLGPARRLSAMTKIAVPRRKDATGAWQDVRVPDHVDILATLGGGLATLGGGAVAHLRFSTVTALAPPSEVWIFGTEGTLRIEADAKRLSGGRRGDKELREIPIPAEGALPAARGSTSPTSEERLPLLRQHLDHHDDHRADEQREPREHERRREGAHGRAAQRAAVVGGGRRRNAEAHEPCARHGTHRVESTGSSLGRRLKLPDVLGPVMRQSLQPLAAGHDLAVRPAKAGLVEVGRAPSGAHQPCVRLPHLSQQLVEAFVLVQTTAHFVHPV